MSVLPLGSTTSAHLFIDGPPTVLVQPKRNAALLLSVLMLSSGCLGLLGPDNQTPEEIDCVEQPSHPDCYVHVITEDDCTAQQIFTGDVCRLMHRPDGLDYGEDSVLLVVGIEMQALTPSFTGDGPHDWMVNPRLPDGLSLDDSGVISGTATEESQDTRYTIIGANPMGSTSATLDITVVAPAPTSIHYIADVLHCSLGNPCSMNAPLVLGGPAESWSADPPLPEGLSLLGDGSISGDADVLDDSNHTVTASNTGGSAEVSIRIITLHEAPSALSYEGHPFYWTIGEVVQIIPATSGGEVTEWSVEPTLPDGVELHQADGSLRGTPTSVHQLREHVITAENTGGSLSTTILIAVRDLAVTD